MWSYIESGSHKNIPLVLTRSNHTAVDDDQQHCPSPSSSSPPSSPQPHQTALPEQAVSLLRPPPAHHFLNTSVSRLVVSVRLPSRLVSHLKGAGEDSTSLRPDSLQNSSSRSHPAFRGPGRWQHADITPSISRCRIITPANTLFTYGGEQLLRMSPDFISSIFCSAFPVRSNRHALHQTKLTM